MSTSTSSQKGNALVFVLLGILVLALIGGAYYLGQQSANNVGNLKNNSVVMPTLTPTSSPQVKVSVPPSPTSSVINYVVPSSWKKWSTYKGGISFYLPPDWNTDGSNIYYQRDANYKPEAGYLAGEVFNGGSATTQYISEMEDTSYLSCGTKNLSIHEEVINNLDVFFIIPIDPQQECRVPQAFIFVRGDKLYRLQMNKGSSTWDDYWNDPNYLNIFYTIIASIK